MCVFLLSIISGRKTLKTCQKMLLALLKWKSTPYLAIAVGIKKNLKRTWNANASVNPEFISVSQIII